MHTSDGYTATSVDSLNSTTQKLRQRAELAKFRISQTTENEGKRAAQEKAMQNCTIALGRLTTALSTYSALSKTISEYIDERRKDSDTAVLAAMRAAAYVVPACDTTIVPRCEDGEAWFETSDGLDVSRLEGSGFRSILSVFMRSVVLRAQSAHLQTLLLDEIFSKLSVENSVTLSSYLPILAQDMQIISIEQKPEVFASTTHVAYKFYLDDNRTVVQGEDVHYD